jgi:putative oxidoreductase
VPWHAICAEFAGALLLIPGMYTRWVSLYALPLMIGASYFWLIRRGFYFTGAGAELPWCGQSCSFFKPCWGMGPMPSARSFVPADTGWSVRAGMRSSARP